MNFIAAIVVLVAVWFGQWLIALLALAVCGAIAWHRRRKRELDEEAGSLAASDADEAGESIEVTVDGGGDQSQLQVGQPTVTYSRHGLASWRLEMRHQGLNKYRVFKATDPSELGIKASLQATEWDSGTTVGKRSVNVNGASKQQPRALRTPRPL